MSATERTILVANQDGEEREMTKGEFVSEWVGLSVDFEYLIVEKYKDDMNKVLVNLRTLIAEMADAKFESIVYENLDNGRHNNVFVPVVIYTKIGAEHEYKEVIGVFQDKIEAMSAVEDFIEGNLESSEEEFEVSEIIYQDHAVH